MTRARDGNENQAQEAMVGWFYTVLPMVEVVHVPNEGKRSKSEAARLKRLGLRVGAADLILYIPGQVITIEAKRPTDKLRKKRAGKMTAEQLDFALRLNAMGHVCFKAEGIDDCRRAFAALGIETREAPQ